MTSPTEKTKNTGQLIFYPYSYFLCLFHILNFKILTLTILDRMQSVTDTCTHGQSQTNMPPQLLQSWGHKNKATCMTWKKKIVDNSGLTQCGFIPHRHDDENHKDRLWPVIRHFGQSWLWQGQINRNSENELHLPVLLNAETYIRHRDASFLTHLGHFYNMHSALH